MVSLRWWIGIIQWHGEHVRAAAALLRHRPACCELLPHVEAPQRRQRSDPQPLIVQLIVDMGAHAAGGGVSELRASASICVMDAARADGPQARADCAGGAAAA